MTLGKQIGGGIVLIVAGIALIGGGIAISDECASGLPPGVTANCSAGPAVLWVFGAFCLFGALLLIGQALPRRSRTIYPATDPAVPPPLIQPVVVQQTLVQQSVKVRCRYCGSLNPVTAQKCAACGAAL